MIVARFEKIKHTIDSIKKNSNFYSNKLVNKIKPNFKFGKLLFFGGFNILFGESDVGKTNLAINIALDMASNGFKVTYWTNEIMVKVIEYRMQSIINAKYKNNIDIILNNIVIINDKQCESKDLLDYANDNLDLLVIDSSSLIHFDDITEEYEEQREYCRIMNKYNNSNCIFLSIHELNKLGLLKGNKTQFYRANSCYIVEYNNQEKCVEVYSNKDVFGYGLSHEKYIDTFHLKKYTGHYEQSWE